MKTIKIIKAVTHGGKLHHKDSILDAEDKTAKLLIDGEFAVEHKPVPTAPPVDQVRLDFYKQFEKCTKEELLKIKADAEQVLAKEPGRKDAASVIEVVTDLLK